MKVGLMRTGWGPFRLFGENRRLEDAENLARKLVSLTWVEPSVTSAQPTTTTPDNPTLAPIVDDDRTVSEMAGPSHASFITWSRPDQDVEIVVTDSPWGPELARGTGPPRQLWPLEQPHYLFRDVSKSGSVLSKELPAALAVLSGEFPEGESESWSRQYKTNLERMASGSPVQVAIVLHDLWHRDQEGQISAGERHMLARARRALRDEIALADTNSQERADEKIEEALRTSGAIADAET